MTFEFLAVILKHKGFSHGTSRKPEVFHHLRYQYEDVINFKLLFSNGNVNLNKQSGKGLQTTRCQSRAFAADGLPLLLTVIGVLLSVLSIGGSKT